MSFCDKCPRGLDNAPCQACPLAMERIEAIQLGFSDADKVGCDFYIVSPEHNYCFWLFARELDASYTNREIAELLGLPQESIDKIFASGLQKWKEMKDSRVMIDFKEALQDSVARHDESSVYYPNQLSEIVHESALANLGKEEDEAEEDEEGIKKKKPRIKVKKKAMKTHLYGLYSQNALKRVRDGKK